MPEIPEVQLLTNQLAAELLNCYIEDVTVNDPMIGENLPVARGQKIIDISRYATGVYLQLSRDAIIVYPAERTRIVLMQTKQRLPNIRAIFHLSCGHLYFMEKSRMPRLVCVIKDETPIDDRGLDPLTKRFNTKIFRRSLRTSRHSIRDSLVKGGIIAGIGNRYANVILERSKLDPSMAANSLPRRKVQQLFWNIKRVLREAIDEVESSSEKVERTI